MSHIKIYALLGVGAILLLVTGFALNERVFLTRYLTYEGGPLALPLAWYAPLETVRGAQQDDLPIADAQDRRVPSDVLDSVTQYSAEQGSHSLIIVHNGVIQTEQYWGDATRDTRFNPQSMSKVLVALLTGIAIDEEHIASVDDPLSFYIDEWRDDPRGRATIQQTLWMTAGLEQLLTSYEVSPVAREGQYAFGDDFMAEVLDLKLKDAPGTTFEYNNDETNVLGLAIERATGKRYADYLSEKLWQPLGLADAALYVDHEGGTSFKHCCAFSRPYDWAKIGLLIANNGQWQGYQIVSADWINAMTTGSPLNKNYGYLMWLGSDYIRPGKSAPSGSGLPVAPEGYAADDMIVLLGLGEQRVWISPSNKLVIVRGTRTWAPSWNETKIPNMILRALY